MPVVGFISDTSEACELSCRQLVKREEGAQEESHPGSSGPESEPDISDIAGDSGKASDPKGKHRLAPNSHADEDAS